MGKQEAGSGNQNQGLNLNQGVVKEAYVESGVKAYQFQRWESLPVLHVGIVVRNN